MPGNLFYNAKFGDMFLTTENKQAVFLRFSENAEYKFAILYVEGWGNVQVFRHNGKAIYDDAAHSIISKQEEPQVKKLAGLQHVNETCKGNGNSLTQEPVSEDFKEFEVEYIEREKDNIVCVYDRHAGLVDGAKWQREKLVANTADAMIGLPYENKDGGYTHLIDVSRPLPVGNNKIAIIFKED